MYNYQWELLTLQLADSHENPEVPISFKKKKQNKQRNKRTTKPHNRPPLHTAKHTNNENNTLYHACEELQIINK